MTGPGRLDAYEVSQELLGEGGYAQVLRATRRTDGAKVALKRQRDTDEDSRRRMSREIVVMRALAASPHVMPVLDAGHDLSWYVMPVADEAFHLDAAPPEITDEELAQLIREVAAGLQAAH